ncbi:Fic/DOC family N-terminal domain-containing protein [Myroides sp. LJL110]
MFFIQELVQAIGGLVGFNQRLKNLHNTEILLALLPIQEAVISARMEATISTMDETFEYETDHETKQVTTAKPDVI